MILVTKTSDQTGQKRPQKMYSILGGYPLRRRRRVYTPIDEATHALRNTANTTKYTTDIAHQTRKDENKFIRYYAVLKRHVTH